MPEIVLQHNSAAMAYADDTNGVVVKWNSAKMAWVITGLGDGGGGGGGDCNCDGITLAQLAAAIAAHNAASDAHADIRSLIAGLSGGGSCGCTGDDLTVADVEAMLDTFLDGLPTYNSATGALTFTRHDGATLTINTVVDSLLAGWDYDHDNHRFVITQSDGNVIYIDASDFVRAYTGTVGAQIQISIASNGAISATLLAGSVELTHLNAALQNLINGKLDAASQAADSAKLGGEAAGKFLRKAAGYTGAVNEYDVRQFANEAAAVLHSTQNPNVVVFAEVLA